MTLDELGLNAARLIGGFAGGVVHVFTVRKFDPLAAAGSVVVGTLTANFLGPAAQHIAPVWMGDYGPAFVVGYCAIIILQGIETMIRQRFRGANPMERNGK
jgi:hypothetical protein